MSYNYEETSVESARDLLRQWRENNERKSEEIINLWLTVLGSDLTQLGNEKHVLLEQVIFAALDCHHYKLANCCIMLLSNEFPGSMRVMRYKAAQLEAEEKYDEALEILNAIIKADETNSAARKRKVAIFKAQGHTSEAIKELVDYLKKFMSDVEAWQELCTLYLQVQDYARAAFCAEEMILHQPHNHLVQQRIADIRYTMGGVENLELAKSYYCRALQLNPDNMRALLGLFLTTNNLLNHYKSSGNSNKRKEVWKLCQWAQAQCARRQRNDTTPARSLARSPTQSPSQSPARQSHQLTEMMLALAITD